MAGPRAWPDTYSGPPVVEVVEDVVADVGGLELVVVEAGSVVVVVAVPTMVFRGIMGQ